MTRNNVYFLVRQRYVDAPVMTWRTVADSSSVDEAMDELKSPPITPIDGTLVKVMDGHTLEVLAFGAWYNGKCRIVDKVKKHLDVSYFDRTGFDWEDAWLNASRGAPITMMALASNCRVNLPVVTRALLAAARLFNPDNPPLDRVERMVVTGVPGFGDLGPLPYAVMDRMAWSLEFLVRYALISSEDSVNESAMINECINAICRNAETVAREFGIEDQEAYLELCRVIRENISLVDLMENISADIE